MQRRLQSGVVQNVNDAPTGGVAIVGTAQEGQTLLIQNTIDDLDGLSREFQYDWRANGESLAMAGNSLIF
jgi:hypothetical protein